MKIAELIEKLNLEVVCPSGDVDITVHGACVSDLLSKVMATCPSNSLWITAQGHTNVIGAASLLGMQAIILAGCDMPDENVQCRARDTGVTLLRSPDNAFDLCGKLYALGIKGGVMP